MKHLDHRQLELLATDNAGVRTALWRRHLGQCADCRQRLAEVTANLELIGELRRLGDDAADPAAGAADISKLVRRLHDAG